MKAGLVLRKMEIRQERPHGEIAAWLHVTSKVGGVTTCNFESRGWIAEFMSVIRCCAFLRASYKMTKSMTARKAPVGTKMG